MGDCCCSYTQNIASHVYVIIGTIHLKKKTRLTKARNEWLGGQLFLTSGEGSFIIPAQRTEKNVLHNKSRKSTVKNENRMW